MNWKAIKHPLAPIALGLAACSIIIAWPVITLKTYPNIGWHGNVGFILMALASSGAKQCK